MGKKKLKPCPFCGCQSITLWPKEKLVVGEAGGKLLKAIQERTEAQLAQAREALKYLANESNWDQEDNNYRLKRPGGFRQEGIYLLSRNLDPWIFAAEALGQKESPTAASLVGTAPVICQSCGKEINPDYGRCQYAKCQRSHRGKRRPR